jgi:cellulose synthase/poly-beta-1,6-N-acetylglucosamine synthase-like glycosyltransferase
MLFSPVSVFLGLANLIYLILNLRLLRGLRNLTQAVPGSKSGSEGIEPRRPTITVLIAARNEELRIAKCLDCLMVQDYAPELLQIIIVNDRSTDRTAAILEDYAARWARSSMSQGLKIVSITESTSGFSPKKFALGKGLEQANGEIIVTTDADCIMSKAWISAIVNEFSTDTGLVLGMTSYYPLGQRNLSSGTQALEFISYGIVAASLIGLGFPVHGNANNIAYRRKVYQEASGFASHSNIVSGDDDFLIQSIHKLGRWKIRYSVHPESQVQTEPPLSIRQFWEQRKRWASKCSLYQPKQAAFLMGIFAYYGLILGYLLLGLYHRYFLWLGLFSWLVKTGADYLVMRRGLRIFSKTDLMHWFPMAAIIHIPLILAAVLAGSFGEFTWKEQTVKRKI